MNSEVVIAKDDGGWVVDRYTGPRVATPMSPAFHHFDVSMLLRIIREWRWIIAGAIALGIAGGIMATLLTTPIYRAGVTLEVNPPTVSVSDEQSREREEQSTNSWDFIATQVGLLKSRSLAERVAQELNLAARPDFVGESGDATSRLKTAAAKVGGGLRVEVPKEGRLINFSYETESPTLAATIANGIAETFIDSNLQRRYQATGYARKFLEKQIARTKADLERSERQLVAYAQSEGIISTSSGEAGRPSGDASSLQGESLVQLNRALAEAVARRVAAEGAYRQNLGVGQTADVASSTQVLRQSKATLEAEYQDKRSLMKPDHPDMVSLRSRIAELDRQINSETSRVSSGRSNTLLAEYRAALAAEQALQARVAQLKGDVLDLRGRSIKYTILQRDVDTNRALYDALLQRYKEVGVASGVGAAPVSIVDRAEPPGGPYKPNVMLNLLFGLGIGLFGGVGAAVGLEFLSDTVKTREDVRTKLGLACFGVIPKTAGKASFVDDLRDPSSAVSEAYSSVVAALRFSTDAGMPKSILVTSTRPFEGKSSTSLALAQNFARRGKSVLLIDADLRKPSFKTSRDNIGLTPLLTNDDSIRSQVVRTQYDNLWLMPCGPLPPNPADLLSTGRFAQIIQEARDSFDVVIIDTPPVLGLADTPLLASASGNVMMVVESGKTRTASVNESIERLRVSGAHILGVTLTKSSMTGPGYGYGYGYGTYGQTALDEKRSQILMIPGEGES